MKHKKVSAALLVALAAASASSPAVAETTFEPYFGLDLMWLDNVNLAGPGVPKQEEYIGQVSPGLRLNQKSQRLTTYLDYQMQALFYESDSDLNQVLHNAGLSADLIAVQDWFSIGADASYFQTLVDPEQPQNSNNLFSVGNNSDTFAGRVTPKLEHRFGPADLLASYSVGIVDYRDDTGATSPVLLDDSRNEEGIGQLSSADAEALVTWLARYEYEHAEYDVSLPFEYERALGEIGIRIVPGLRLIGRGGEESDPFDFPSDGGLDESFWAAGFDYRRGQKFQLRVLGGERFFGTSWEALLSAKGRILEFELTYEETPTTQTQRVSMRDVQPPDPALPVAPVPPDAQLIGRATSETYLLKGGHAQLTAVGRVTRIGAEVSAEEREYVLLGGVKDKFSAGRVFVNRRFGAYTFAELAVGLIRGDLREGGEYRDNAYDLQIGRELGARTTLSLNAHHLSRSGDLDEYDANWVSLGLLMTF